ncbi:AraC family transcriptional regulator [Duganella aceris]|uniref:AraC family transcriptional regulator n=1 Tax=Duganella aceris TaxID=2703883 RepID=A0ABX0FKM7_9BURK|nr:AraC family transcriptional regulator [Duganella aceris]NGZ85073.1 AraC family transcriptional regulator [Duganella aceris]
MNTVNQWLKTVRSEDAIFARTRISGGWGFEMERQDAITFHFVAEGHAYVQVETQPPIMLHPYDLVMFPRGEPHRVMHCEDGATIPLRQFIASGNDLFGTLSGDTTIVCGTVRAARIAKIASQTLPQMLILRGGPERQARAILETLRLLGDEIESDAGGDEIVLNNLLSNLFVYVLRTQAPDAARLNDGRQSPAARKQILRAVECIHSDPATPWDVDGLSGVAGLSRTRFIREFRQLTGKSPHQYLLHRRMELGAQLLENTTLRLAEIAVRVGYRSEFSFSRAFKKLCKVSPSHLRAGRNLLLRNDLSQ